MELRHFTIKKQLNTKRENNTSSEGQNVIEYQKQIAEL